MGQTTVYLTTEADATGFRNWIAYMIQSGWIPTDNAGFKRGPFVLIFETLEQREVRTGMISQIVSGWVRDLAKPPSEFIAKRRQEYAAQSPMAAALEGLDKATLYHQQVAVELVKQREELMRQQAELERQIQELQPSTVAPVPASPEPAA